MGIKAAKNSGMRLLSLFLLVCAGTACSETVPAADDLTRAALSEEAFASQHEAGRDSVENYRGWDYLAQKLISDGILAEDVERVFFDPRFPEFTPVPFQLKPKETSHMYVSFTQERHIKVAHDFINAHKDSFAGAERKYGVSRYTIAAILLIETYCGANVGDQLVAYRLARVSSVGDPRNLEFNLLEQRKRNPEVTLDEVKNRARYLEETFYPEFRALFEMRDKFGIDFLELRGSIAGAFGYPQFLPQSFLRLAVDGDGDGTISLFSVPDAIFSAAHFLSHNGWRDSAPLYEKKKALWAYNRSEAYGDAILKVSIRLREHASKKAFQRAPSRKSA